MLRRAGAKRRECGLYDRELSAGAAFVLAGFSAGTGGCARGGTAEQFGMRSLECEIEARWAHGETASSGHCGKPLPHAAFHVPFDTRTGLWKSIAAFYSSHACCLPRERQTGRFAMCCAFCSAGVGIALVRSRMVRGYRAYWVYFRFVRFFMAIPTGNDRSRVYDKERRVGWAFLLIWLWFALRYDTAGRTLGLKCGSRTAAAPDCAKESKVEAALRPLWTLFMWGAA